MKIDIVPIAYGLNLGIDSRNLVEIHKSNTFWAAKRKLFPESTRRVRAGDVVFPEDKEEVYYCQRCRDNEERWAKKHPALAGYHW
jgi:hypothetical protein